MKFLLDHDVAAAVKNALDRHGHEVIRLTDLLPRNAPDDVVFATAQSNQCVMITCNRNDFIKLAGKGPHLGLIILIRRRTARAEYTNLLRLIQEAGEDGMRGNINFACCLRSLFLLSPFTRMSTGRRSTFISSIFGSMECENLTRSNVIRVIRGPA